MTFKEELIAFLTEYGIEYDEIAMCANVHTNRKCINGYSIPELT
jgi:hypothetical protein